jgi:L-threonine kinase
VLTDVEPNDGLHFDNTSAYHHTEGGLIANFDWVPPFRILGIDQGGVVDTVAFNRRAIVWTEAQMTRYRALLDAMLVALGARDSGRVAALSTESTRAWQDISPKTDLDAVLTLAEKLDASGVINTHSGTYLGLLFPDDASLDQPRLASIVAEQFPRREIAWYLTTGCQAAVAEQLQEKRRLLG